MSTTTTTTTTTTREDEIIYRPLNKPVLGQNGYVGFQPGKKEILPKGFVGKTGWDGLDSRQLTSDIVLEHDVEIVVRDGTKLYADLYYPHGLKEGEKVPFIVSWSPYGKKYSATLMLPVCTWKCGVLPKDISGFEKFEGVDPAIWCPKGYAIASVDQRGSGHSEGNICIMGPQDNEDAYDVIEWLAKLPYCNGKVGLAGNSHLAISQYFIAALQPPSLAAIAPWEGLSDLYRDQFVRGGIFTASNFNLIASIIYRGSGGVEDFEAMYRAHPYATSKFWSDKRVDFSKINIPVFLNGSDVSSLHTMGVLRAWTEIPSERKWLNWSALQEWCHLYSVEESTTDLMGFFDRFLKDVENGWDVNTPKVRMSVLNFGDVDAEENIVVKDWPLPETVNTPFYLAEGAKLSLDQPKEVSTVTYESTSFEDDGTASFAITFDKRTRIIGVPLAHVFVSCDDHDDMCLFVQLRKLDSKGNVLKHVQVPMERRWVEKFADIPQKDHTGLITYPGALGILRASRRKIDRDPKKTWHPHVPFHPHDEDQFVPKGTVVELEIGIWHCGYQFEQGETLRVDVSGTSPNYPELREMNGDRPDGERNRGLHKVHFGGEYPSRVVLPMIPM
ncbi:alpha/beta-hydrolase [Meredithblackwellia eburnea MCA 4105]